ncbi:MAG TPA: VOC family protein [Terricaulis sp.]|nr:VOC family protein [Terricaulis sp.]
MALGAPVAFVYVTDRARALGFYEGVLGLKLSRADAFGDYLEWEGALLRMTVMADHKPSPHPVLGWNVADITAFAALLHKHGLAFTRYDGMGQDDLGIWTAPDGASKVAFFSDPDGNVLSVSQG